MRFNYFYDNTLKTFLAMQMHPEGDPLASCKIMTKEEAEEKAHEWKISKEVDFVGTFIEFREVRYLFDSEGRYIGYRHLWAPPNSPMTWGPTYLLAEHVLEGSNRSGYAKNDALGSSHWMNTLMGQVARIGQHMQTNKNLTPDLREWGQQLQNVAHDVQEWHQMQNENKQ